jgi:hypothetical protein
MGRVLLLVLVAGVLAGCGGSEASSDGGSEATPRVTSISSVLELRAAFNEERGQLRLLLLLSPT